MPISPHDAYKQAYKKAQFARDNAKSYIAIQNRRNGSFRLIATNDPRKMDACCMQTMVQAWATNIVYRLSYLGHIVGGNDALDDYFNQLDGV